MAANSTNLSDAIREAFRRSGRSIKSVADEAGLHYAMAHGLLRDREAQDVRLSTGSRVAAVLGLELRPVRRKGNK